jgi:hypothetical protein
VTVYEKVAVPLARMSRTRRSPHPNNRDRQGAGSENKSGTYS